MSTRSPSVDDFILDPERTAPHPTPLSRRIYWQLRRELWESRSIYLAPLGMAALILLGFLISMFHLPSTVRAALALDSVRQQEILQQPYHIAAFLIMASTFLVAIFYPLDALYGERRDRSILFWKSLPVSDLMTVLVKASIPVFVLPLLTLATCVVTQAIMLMMSTMALLGSGLDIQALWSSVSLFQTWLMLFFHLVGIHGLWYAPIYGWLLLVSAWARRAPFLWAALPLLAIGVVEKIAFNTSHFAYMLENHFGGAPQDGSMSMKAIDPSNPWQHVHLFQFLSSTGLWTGLAVTAVFLAAAVRLRHLRQPI